jgi:hypothetical protein
LEFLTTGGVVIISKNFELRWEFFDDKIRRIGRISLLFLKQNKIIYYLCRSVQGQSGGGFKGEIRWKIIDGARLNGTARAAFASGCRRRTEEKH